MRVKRNGKGMIVREDVLVREIMLEIQQDILSFHKVSKMNKTFGSLGCTRESFRIWIKFRFTEDMTSQNYCSFWIFEHNLLFSFFKSFR